MCPARKVLNTCRTGGVLIVLAVVLLVSNHSAICEILAVHILAFRAFDLIGLHAANPIVAGEVIMTS